MMEVRQVDQIVVNHATQPLAENLGAVDYDAFIDGHPQTLDGGPKGFRLYRIGDAVASRNTHAAIYDALRGLTNSGA